MSCVTVGALEQAGIPIRPGLRPNDPCFIDGSTLHGFVGVWIAWSACDAEPVIDGADLAGWIDIGSEAGRKLVAFL